MLKPYPEWICAPCGREFGRREAGVSTWHEGDACDLCGAEVPVTEPRDFGHLKEDWRRLVLANLSRMGVEGPDTYPPDDPPPRCSETEDLFGGAR